MAVDNVTLSAGIQSNLNSLQKTSRLMDDSSNRMATGKSVNSPTDDPMVYFSALEKSYHVNDLNFLKDGISESLQTIKAANNGIEAIEGLMASAKSLANSAQAISGTDAESQGQRNVLAAQFSEVMSQINSLAKDSGYAGVNLLNNSNLEVPLNEDGSSSITVAGVNNTTEAGGDIAIAVENNWDSISDVETSLADINTAMNELRGQSETLSNNLSTISTRNDFIQNTIQTFQEGIENLTTVDLNEEAANQLALQTRQQLGSISLSLASKSAQNILKLF